MPTEIFISYSRIDDQNKKIQAFIERMKANMSQTFGKRQLDIFMDFKSIDLGVHFETEIVKRAQESHILLAFLSPSYFQTEWCIKEWEIFIERYKRNNDSVAIVPIIWQELQRDLEDGTKFQVRDELISERKAIFDEAVKLQYSNWYSLKDTDPDAEKELERISGKIHRELKKRSTTNVSVKNIQIIHESIEEAIKVKGKNWKGIDSKIRKTPRSFQSISPVCVIYTGGTVGMVHENEFDKNSVPIIGSIEQLVKNLPRLRNFKFDIHFFSYKKPLDSSNMGSDDWLILGSIIKELDLHYQGFVVLHGANTLAYTASALSFMFEDLNKPIILTGAEIPLVELNSDAAQNVSWAIQCAAHETNLSPGFVPEVCVMYGKYLLRGNRSTKMHSLNTIEGFDSPNFSPLGKVENNRISLNHRDIRTVGFDGERVLGMQMNTQFLKKGIITLQTYPDMDMDFIKPVLENPNLKGLIIQSYGTGSAPDMLKGFLDQVEILLRKGVIIVNITQCPFGKVELQLHETSARFYDLGVIHGGDMTTEAAYCKLKYLMGYYRYSDMNDEQNREVIKREFQRNLRGELTFSAYPVRYSQGKSKLEASPLFAGGAVSVAHFDFESSTIDHAFVRIQGIQVQSQSCHLPENNHLEIEIYLDNQNIDPNSNKHDFHFQLGGFKRQYSGLGIDHNIEVTSQVRRLLKRTKHHCTMQVLSVSGHSISFESLELVVYTKN